jgi:hypothetical protein
MIAPLSIHSSRRASRKKDQSCGSRLSHAAIRSSLTFNRRAASASEKPAVCRAHVSTAGVISALRRLAMTRDTLPARRRRPRREENWLSALLLGSHKMVHWTEVGSSMIAIETLVHNFLHRTGILARFNATHPYGAACYRPSGCADIIQAVAERIDARQFNPSFPQTFPRFVQYAIWHYCSQSGLDVCNGNRIDDAERCGNLDCRVRLMCDRVVLRKVVET